MADVPDIRQFEIKVVCESCFTVAHIKISALPTVTGVPEYCVQCGAHGRLGQRQDVDPFAAIAIELNADKRLVKLLYEEWDRQAYSSFRDYVAAALAEGT